MVARGGKGRERLIALRRAVPEADLGRKKGGFGCAFDWGEKTKEKCDLMSM